MRLIVDENVSGTVIHALREQGHDVLSVKEEMRSESDETILRRAQDEGRIVVTHDKDFGELAFRWRLQASCGVILLRLSGVSPENDNQRILKVMNGEVDLRGHFTVVTDDLVRIRPLR